jgi:hypothetical protein
MPGEAPPSPASARVTPPESRNYQLYRCKVRSRTYLVVSTFFDREGRVAEEPGGSFEEVSIKELGADLFDARMALEPDEARWETSRVEVTLRAHGYNTRFPAFHKAVLDESDDDPNTTFRPENRFYIGYRWPSVGIVSGRAIRDTLRALAITSSITFLMLLIPVLALWVSVSGRLNDEWRVLLGPYAWAFAATLAIGFGTAMGALRGSTYLSDRYRALHYGVPDLIEFVRDLDDQVYAMRVRADLDLVGHSMGCLLLVNAVRIMSDFFHFPGEESPLSRMSSICPRTLVLCAADIPMALAVPGRNNYFLSSLRRFTGIHVLSSDSDVILKWASNLGNWVSEPRFDMSSRRLGNAILVPIDIAPDGISSTPHLGDWLPVARPSTRYIPAAEKGWTLPPKSRVGVLHFHDCTPCWSVGGDMRSALWSAAIATILGLFLWFSQLGPIARWGAGMIWLAFSIGCLSRWLMRTFSRNWTLSPILGALADWPSSSTMFGPQGRNPHGGYFARKDMPRSLIANILASPAEAGSPVLFQAPPPIRSSALLIPV